MAVLPIQEQERLTIEEAARRGYELTYEEYLRTPETMQRYEIVDGKVIMSPAATSYHQSIEGELYVPFKTYVQQHRLGVVLMAPVDVVITRTPKLRTRQPDLLYLSRARTGIRNGRDLIAMPQIEVTPEITVELLSPEEERRTLDGKLADYARIGVPEVWLVDPPAETLEVLNLAEGRYTRTALYGRDDTLHSIALPGFTLALAALFTMEDADVEDADVEDADDNDQNDETQSAEA